MPELPELTVIQEVLDRRITGQTILAAEGIAPGAAIVIRDLTGAGFGVELASATFQSIARRGKFLEVISKPKKAVLDFRAWPGEN